MSKDNVTRRISIFVNGKEVENSLKGVEGAMAQVRNRMRLLNSDSETYEKDSKELAKTMSDLRQRQSEYRDELGLTNKAMEEANEISGGLRGTLTGIWDSLVSGDLQGAREGISSITSGMGGLVKSSLAFIATPIGAAIAGLAGLAAGAKAMFDFNVNAEKGAQLIENLSGKTGQAVEDIRIRIQSLTDTFGIEFDALAGAVDNLVDTGVAKDELEALDKIKQGLLTAPDKNEFISSLENSAVTAKQVGLDLEEVIALKKQIEETGVNPEATFGALEKAGKNLALQTDTLRNSLSSAFGAAFTDDVLAKVKTGQITTVQALDLINTKSKEVGLNQTQQAELGAQLFGKAALSAGGYATVLDTVSGGLRKQKEDLNGNQLALDQLYEANLRLNAAQSALFRVENFGEVWTKIKAKAIDALASVLFYIKDLIKDIQPVIDLVGVVFANAWEYLKTTVGSAFDFIGGVLKAFSNSISTIFNFIKKVFQGDFTGAIDVLKKGILSLGSIVEETFGKIQNRIINALKAIVDNVAPFLEAIGMDVDKIQKKLDSFKNKEVELKTNQKSESNAKAAAEEAKKAEAEKTKALKEELAKQQAVRDEAAKAEAQKRKDAIAKQKAEEEKAKQEKIRKEKEYLDAIINMGKAELDYYIANNQSKIQKNGELTQVLVDEETKRLADIKQKKLAQLGLELGTNEGIIAIKQQQGIDLSANDLEYLTKKQELDLQFQQETALLQNNFEEQEKAKKAEQLLADKEIKLLEAESEWEAQRIQADERYNTELADLNERLRLGYLTKEQFAKLEKDLEKRTAEDKVMIARAERDAKLQEYGTMFGNIATLLGENTAAGKAAALANVAISQGMAVARIWEQESTLPSPFDIAAKVAGTAVAVANVIAAAKQISSVKTPKSTNTKFFYGGSTGTNAALGYDEFGPVTGYVHKNEYVIPEVMTQDPRFANTIGWLEANRQNKMRGYVDGGATSPGVVGAENPQMNNETAQMNNLLVALLNRLENPIAPNLVIGYKDVENLEDMKNEITSASQNGTIG